MQEGMATGGEVGGWTHCICSQQAEMNPRVQLLVWVCGPPHRWCVGTGQTKLDVVYKAQGVGKRSLKCGRLKLGFSDSWESGQHWKLHGEVRNRGARGPVGSPGTGVPKLLDIHTPLGLKELGTELGPWAEELKARGMRSSGLSHRRLCLA